MKTADVLRSLDKDRLHDLAAHFDLSLQRANENAETLCTRLARSLGASWGWRESLEAVLALLRNDELRGFLAAHSWEVVTDQGEDLQVDVYRSTRLSELAGPDLRKLVLDLADAADAGAVEAVFSSRKWRAHFLLTESYVLGEDGQRQTDGDRGLGVEELADMSVTDARAVNVVADLARVTGLTTATVERRLGEAHGRTLLPNCFHDRWPSEPTAEDLAELTVSDAREHGLISALAGITGMTPGGIARRLNSAHGRTLLTTCFSDRWPDSGREQLEADELGQLNVSDAIDRDLVADLADVTGMSLMGVRRRLNSAHGRTLLTTCFEDRWPIEEESAIELDELAGLNVAEALDRDLAETIAELVGMSTAGVQRRLNAVHGRTLVGNCFSDRWPDGEPLDAEALAALTVAEASQRDLAADIAVVTGMSPQGARRRLDGAHGNTLLQSCFADRWPDDLGLLAQLNVSDARARRLIGILARLLELSEGVVQRRLRDAHGRTLLPHCFEREWPAESVASAPDGHRRKRLSPRQPPRPVGTSPRKRAGTPELGRSDPKEASSRKRSSGTPNLVLDRDGRVVCDGVQLRDDHVWIMVNLEHRLDEDLSLRVHKELMNARPNTLADARRVIEAELRKYPEMIASDVKDSIKVLLEDLHASEAIDFRDARPEPQPVARAPRAPAQGKWDVLRVVNDRWELIKNLGSGGFGTAFEALDLDTKGPNVVIKFPRPEDPETVRALKREYEVTRLLQHPNICTYWHYDQDGQFRIPFVVVQYGGESISHAIRAGAFTPERAISITSDAANALDHVHTHNQIHGDINPGNVLVLDGRAMLMDFGVSANVETQRQPDGAYTKIATSLHGYHRVYGSQDDPTTRRSDQYSLALVLCTMLEGRVFEGRYHFKGFPQLSASQNEAISRALAERAADRFSSCTAFAQALKAGQDAEK